MSEKVLKSAKGILHTPLIPSRDLKSLDSILNEVKKKNYNKDLNGYRPDLQQSVKNISQFIVEAFNWYKEVVVFACDAISYQYYLSQIQKISRNYSHAVGVLSSVFPTTTSVVWPTIITDKWPSEHGIYGTSFLHEKFNKNYVWITNTLNIKDERTLVNDRDMKLNLSGAETIFEKLKKQNIVSYYLGTHGQGVFNPFRSELTRGANHIEPGNIYPELKKDPQRLVDYFIDKDTELLKKEERCLIWNYIDFDDFIHEHGYEKLSEKINWDSIFEFWKVNKQDRLFIFISDHGQTIQKPGSSSILKTSTLNPDLAHNSAGAGRVLYFYPSQDKENDVYAWVKNIVGDEGVVMTKKDLINSGLINSNAAGINRIGSVIAIAKETGRSFPSTGYKYVAEHGALSSDEMYVPIIIQF